MCVCAVSITALSLEGLAFLVQVIVHMYPNLGLDQDGCDAVACGAIMMAEAGWALMVAAHRARVFHSNGMRTLVSPRMTLPPQAHVRLGKIAPRRNS
jgi:hypothetical protein